MIKQTNTICIFVLLKWPANSKSILSFHWKIHAPSFLVISFLSQKKVASFLHRPSPLHQSAITFCEVLFGRLQWLGFLSPKSPQHYSRMNATCPLQTSQVSSKSNQGSNTMSLWTKCPRILNFPSHRACKDRRDSAPTRKSLSLISKED